MTAFPFFLAVILPLLFTVATFLLEEVYVTFPVAVIGAITGLNVFDLPFFKETVFGTPVILLTATADFCTVILICFVNPLANVTVTTAFPVLLFAVIFPLLFTVTILVLLDFQDFT